MNKELLKLMEKNAKLSVCDLAALLGKDENEVSSAITELEEKNIIDGYHTVINWDDADADVCKAVITVHATPERDSGYDHIASLIANYPEVDSLYLISGSTEFLLIINGSTMKEVANFVAHKLAPIDGVHSTETMFILKEYKLSGEIMNRKSSSTERLIVTP